MINNNLNGKVMKKVKMFVLLALSLCITLFATSCSEDETSQASFNSLNMLDENHGKTLLGETGVYINGSMNFRSDSWQVIDLGISSSFPSKTMPNLDNLSSEISVLPNHRYACCNTKNVLTFPSHKKAYEIGCKYYQFVVSSFLEKETGKVGAVVEYTSSLSDEKELPQKDTNIGNLFGLDEQLSFDALGAEEYCFFEKSEDFAISLSNGHLKVALRKSPNELYGPYGTYSIYLRKGNVYTKVTFDVDL